VCGNAPERIFEPKASGARWEWSRCQVRSPLSMDDPVFCEARIRGYRDRFDYVGVHGAGRLCERLADGEVCGVALCWQHRREVTYWESGPERLSPRVDAIFSSWGVERRGPFIPTF
jgi:hypothetical protein